MSEPDLLNRLRTIRNQASMFGDVELSTLMHDTILVLMSLGTTVGQNRAQLLEAYDERARLQKRIKEQVRLIRSMRTETDSSHSLNPVEEL